MRVINSQSEIVEEEDEDFPSTIYRVALFPVLTSFFLMLAQQLNDNAQSFCCQSDVDWLELLEQQQFETPRQTWCLCCCDSGVPGVDAFVVSRYPDYLSEKEVRRMFNEEGYPSSYWIQKLPVDVQYRYESSGEWEA